MADDGDLFQAKLADGDALLDVPSEVLPHMELRLEVSSSRSSPVDEVPLAGPLRSNEPMSWRCLMRRCCC